GALAGGHRHDLGRRHHLHRDRRHPRAAKARRAPARHLRTLIIMTSTAEPGAEPILLAFSGGLDTSFCVPWLKETYQRPEIPVTVVTGGDDPWARKYPAQRL